MVGPDNTPPETLVRAAAIGRTAGLRYVYAGNLPGQTDGLENTRCPSCGAVVVERRGFRVLHNRIAGEGQCPACGAAIPGVWAVGAAMLAPGRHRADAGDLIHIRCG